ncbi:hypothetical protein [Mycoplasma leonicaptivi]|uniref:hypothetical protein n=1 Tax=Mycoplasma leonicaptivi TaxID=36742 RepID=UPI000485A493|nr:hypothetical protein [Mycoplasma leonicaptivi]
MKKIRIEDIQYKILWCSDSSYDKNFKKSVFKKEIEFIKKFKSYIYGLNAFSITAFIKERPKENINKWYNKKYFKNDFVNQCNDFIKSLNWFLENQILLKYYWVNYNLIIALKSLKDFCMLIYKYDNKDFEFIQKIKKKENYIKNSILKELKYFKPENKNSD